MEGLKLKPAKDIRHLIEDFCEDCRLRGMTNESIRRYKSSLLIFADFLADKGVSVGSQPLPSYPSNALP